MRKDMRIVDGVVIALGDKLSDVQYKLNSTGVEYLSRNEVKGKDEMVWIFMQQYGVEISLYDKRISHIKAANSMLNYVLELSEGGDLVTHLEEVIQGVMNRFEIAREDVTLVEFNGKYIYAVFLLRDGDKQIKVNLVKSFDRKVYLQVMKVM